MATAFSATPVESLPARKAGVAAILLLCTMRLPALEVVPPNPTTCDEIEFLAARVFGRDCGWQLEQQVEISAGAPARVQLVLTAQPTRSDCPQAFTHVQFRGSIGRLPAGEYVLSARWTDVSPETPQETANLHVAEAGCRVHLQRGDGNGDGRFDIADPITTLGTLFLGTPIACLAAADADASGVVELTDAVYALGYLFFGGPAPGAPFPECGPLSARDEALGCDGSACPVGAGERPIWMSRPDGCVQCEPCTAPSLAEVVRALEEAGVHVLSSRIDSLNVCHACRVCTSGRFHAVLVAAADAPALEAMGWRATAH